MHCLRALDFIGLWPLGLWAISRAVSAVATPVYLNMESRFPSGQYARSVLEARTEQTRMQHWLHVQTRDHAFGWISESELLTPLKLAGEAVVVSRILTPRSEWTAAKGRQELLPPGRRVKILEVNGSYAHVHPLDSAKETSFWIPNLSLKPVHSANGEKAFLPRETPIFILPGQHARVQFEARAASFYTIAKQDKVWLEIQTPVGKAYLRRADSFVLDDLTDGQSVGVRPLTSLTPLRSAPIPYADVLRHLPAGTPLKVIGGQDLRWGLAHVREAGQVWWPINNVNFAFDDEDDGAATGAGPSNRGVSDERGREHLTNDELFKRKIFDMASNPVSPNVKFVSCDGVFRTTDGQSWVRIPLFKKLNYPIAISGGGAVFIGPYVSEDGGDTFQEWIRWDSLFATLQRKLGYGQHALPHGLQIQEIRPETPSGQRVVLKISLGPDLHAKLTTTDQGLNWH